MGTDVEQVDLEVEVEVTPKDYRLMARRLARANRYRYTVLVWVALVTGIGAAGLNDADDPVVGWLLFVSLIAWWIHTISFGRALVKDTIGRTRRFSLTEDGVTVHDTRSSCTWWWSAFERIDETDDHFFLLIDPVRAYVVPKRCFTSDDDVARARALVAAATPVGG